jgi:uncharacterized Ntn-hydrolase superfamily protein
MKPGVFLLLVLLFITANEPVPAGGEPVSSLRPVHTYSIVARDPATGQLGVAVQSHWFAVGSLVPWAQPGVGAVATQSFVDVRYGVEGLQLMAQGKPAGQALRRLLATDPNPAVRQVGMIDADGRTAQHTGDRCIQYAGHLAGDNFAVQANLMAVEGVPEAMAKAYENARGPLAQRLLTALEAAEAVGGDLRGKQSAAVLVVRARPGVHPWEDRLVDLHVEDHPTPLLELRRLLRLHTAYRLMNLGDHALEANDIEGALAHYGQAEILAPDNLEMKFWHAVSLANAGRADKAMPLFATVFREDRNWQVLLPRLAEEGLVNVDPATLSRIVNVIPQEALQ